MSKDTEQELWDAIDEYVKDCMQLSSMAKAEHCKPFAVLTGVVDHLCGGDGSSELSIKIDFDEHELEALMIGMRETFVDLINEASPSVQVKAMAQSLSDGMTAKGRLIIDPDDLCILASEIVQIVLVEESGR